MEKRSVILAALLVLPIMFSLAGATYVSILEPYTAVINSKNAAQGIFLGNVGPGQTFFITINSSTTNSNGILISPGWDELIVTGLPAGWVAQNSSLYTSQLSIAIRPSPTAVDGKYGFNVTAINLGTYSKLGSLAFKAYVNVTPNVFKLSVSPSIINVGTGEPAYIYVTINNTGVSDSPFLISLSGLPAWTAVQQVIALHGTQKTFLYPVYEDTPGVYNLGLQVTSLSSASIYKNSSITLTAQATVLNDYAAIGQGALIFPVVFSPAYAIMHLIGSIFKQN